MPAQEDYERFRALAEELELEDDAAEKFVNDAMKRKGYKPSTAWSDPEPEEQGKDEGDFFGNRRKKREEEQQQKEQQQEREKEDKPKQAWGY